MPSYVIKVDPDHDFYVYWSTIVEAPVAYGDRAYIRDHLASRPDSDRTDIDARLRRADDTGSSALWPSTIAPAYGWDDSGLIYQQQGWLPRYRLRELCERLDIDAPVDDLLEPLEDK